MMRKQRLEQRLRLWLFLWIAMDASGNDSFTITREPGFFLKEQNILSNTLVILDLDDTTITTPEGQWLGRSEMFYDYLSRSQRKYPEKSKAQLTEVIDPLFLAVYEKVPVILTDPSLPAQINALKEKGATVIAMTARGKGTSDITKRQLEWLGVEFSDISETHTLAIDSTRSIEVESGGVVMVSQGVSKGEALLALLKKGAVKIPDHIILIDDRPRHLRNVSQALAGSYPAIQYQPVLCTYLEGKRKYHSQEADHQLIEHLLKHSDDKAIKMLIRNDPYTRSILLSCPVDSESKQQQCENLLKQDRSDQK